MDQIRALWQRHFPQLINPSDPDMQNLVASATLTVLPAGKTLFYPGAPCQNYVLVVAGTIRVHLISENGREVLLYEVLPGDSCILTTACLLGQKAYPAEGITEDEVQAFVIGRYDFQRALDRSTLFRSFVFENFSARLASVITRMEEVVFEAIERRLAKHLLAASDGRLTITHQKLAAELGTAREVISRNLKRFERYGWITLSRGAIVIQDPAALKRLLDTE